MNFSNGGGGKLECECKQNLFHGTVLYNKAIISYFKLIMGNNMTNMSKSILGGSKVFFSNVDLANKWLSITPLFTQKREH